MKALVSDDREISQVREEVSEAAGPNIRSSAKERSDWKSSFWIHSIKRTEHSFTKCLIELDRKPGSSEYEKSMKMFDEYRRAKQQRRGAPHS